MMRLLVGSHTSVVRGGAEVYLRGLLPALEARGWEVRMLVEDGSAVSALAPGEKERVIASCPPGTDRTAAIAAVRDWKPDVVLQNGLLDSGLERELLRIAPSVLFAHAYYGTCISGQKRFATPSLQRCHRTFGPSCLALYYPRRCGGLSPVTAVSAYRLQRSRAALFPLYARVCVASEAMRSEYLQHGLPGHSVALVPYFPNLVAPDPEQPSSGSTEAPILMVGRLTEVKGGTLLLEAVALAQQARGRPMRVHFAGEGPQQALLERLSRKLGVEAKFFGWCNAAQRQDLMRSASLLAVPSTWPEPFGIVGIEAACVGLPAVGFATGGIPDWLIDGYSGMSADGERPRADTLAGAIIRALEDPIQYLRLRRGAWEISHRFSLVVHLDQLDAILRTAAMQDERIDVADL
jgi:glycosyltransferase involved in cell wall biosynthesis